jgi:recombination protein RecR
MAPPRPHAPAALPPEVGQLVARLRGLPGVGKAAALKYALALLMAPRGPTGLAEGLVATLGQLLGTVGTCPRCNALATRGEVCPVCADRRRDDGLLCVVGRVQDLLALERGGWRGRYFVLGKLVSPLEGVDAADLPLAALRARVADGVREVLLGLPATVDGNTTAMLLARELRESSIAITKLAGGVRSNGDVAEADPITLGTAIQERTPS